MLYPEFDPLEVMTDLRRRLYRVLEGSQPQPPAAEQAYSPPLDICQTAEGVVITVELPGLTRESIDVSLAGDRLTISGERPPLDVGAGQVLRQERPSGRFVRSLTLSQGHARQISASFAQGVLTVRVSPSPTGGEQ